MVTLYALLLYPENWTTSGCVLRDVKCIYKLQLYCSLVVHDTCPQPPLVTSPLLSLSLAVVAAAAALAHTNIPYRTQLSYTRAPPSQSTRKCIHSTAASIPLHRSSNRLPLLDWLLYLAHAQFTPEVCNIHPPGRIIPQQPTIHHSEQSWQQLQAHLALDSKARGVSLNS